MSKTEALRQAQLDTLAEYPDPFYWAAVTLSGDGGRGQHLAGDKAESHEGVGVEAQPGNNLSPLFCLICGGGLLIVMGLLVTVVIKVQRLKFQPS